MNIIVLAAERLAENVTDSANPHATESVASRQYRRIDIISSFCLSRVPDETRQDQTELRNKGDDHHDHEEQSQVPKSGPATSLGFTRPTEQATRRLIPTGGMKTEIPCVAAINTP